MPLFLFPKSKQWGIASGGCHLDCTTWPRKHAASYCSTGRWRGRARWRGEWRGPRKGERAEAKEGTCTQGICAGCGHRQLCVPHYAVHGGSRRSCGCAVALRPKAVLCTVLYGVDLQKCCCLTKKAMFAIKLYMVVVLKRWLCCCYRKEKGRTQKADRNWREYSCWTAAPPSFLYIHLWKHGVITNKRFHFSTMSGHLPLNCSCSGDEAWGRVCYYEASMLAVLMSTCVGDEAWDRVCYYEASMLAVLMCSCAGDEAWDCTWNQGKPDAQGRGIWLVKQVSYVELWND
jgi:hypothetical protein